MHGVEKWVLQTNEELQFHELKNVIAFPNYLSERSPLIIRDLYDAFGRRCSLMRVPHFVPRLGEEKGFAFLLSYFNEEMSRQTTYIVIDEKHREDSLIDISQIAAAARAFSQHVGQPELFPEIKRTTEGIFSRRINEFDYAQMQIKPIPLQLRSITSKNSFLKENVLDHELLLRAKVGAMDSFEVYRIKSAEDEKEYLLAIDAASGKIDDAATMAEYFPADADPVVVGYTAFG